MNRLIISAALILTLIATSADAASRSRGSDRSAVRGGMYFSGNIGMGLLSDAENEQSPIILESSFDPGYNASGAIGFEFSNFRAEAEVAYHRNAIKSISAGGVSVNGEGTVSAMSLMANGYYDFGSGKPFLVPYLGVGVGYALVDADETALGTQFVDDSAGVFAYQVMAGVGFSITSDTTLTAGYRYFATENPEFNDMGGTPFESEYQTHEVNVGIRIEF